jgi:formylglycine-generating enzyme required for sulfatase activity
MRISRVLTVWLVAGVYTTGCLEEEMLEPDDPGLVFVNIPGGSFLMGCQRATGEPCKYADGSQATVRQITIRPFAIMRTEVTQAQWEAVTGRPPYFSPEYGFPTCGDCPAAMITLEEARSFCKEFGARLPSEAEWEYAARAGSTSNFPGPCTHTSCPNSDVERIAGNFGWYEGNSGGRPHPVGTKAANSFGLYDVLGNLSEFVEDCYQPSIATTPVDGSPVRSCPSDDVLLRGGGYRDAAVFVYARWFMEYGRSYVGVRCAKDMAR